MKVVIIGGVAGGATAAARIRRLDEKAEIVVFERSGFISYANCGLPYYIGGTIEDENELDTYGELYNSEGTLLKCNDDDKGMQFGISYVMELGQTVVLKVRRYNYGAGSFDIIVEKDTRVYPEEITLSDAFRKCT